MPLESDLNRPNWTFQILLLVVATAIVALSFLLYVDGPVNVVIPWLNIPLPGTCSMRRVAGIDCPGCGLTRSFVSLAHGHWQASLVFNPAGLLLFPMVAFQIPYRIAQLWRLSRGLRPWNLSTASFWLWGLIGVILLIQWISKLI